MNEYFSNLLLSHFFIQKKKQIIKDEYFNNLLTFA